VNLRLKGRAVTDAMQRRIAPTVRYSQTHFEEFLISRVKYATAWLDLGCGHHLLPEWRESAERDLLAQVPFAVGVDYHFPSLRMHRSLHNLARADARRLPFRDESFDLVTANMVVEHLDDPDTQFGEVARVLRPGGTFIFHTPNASSYFVFLARLLPDVVKRPLVKLLDGREEHDVFPTHYRANRDRDIQRIAARSGFEPDEVKFVSSGAVAAVFPFVSFFELLVLRQLERPSLARYRSNIICALRKA
jgi:ubiquinone/menaquinone biosynthesis C-methylase UbiE